jgi:DNA-binding winged helix-turn-helix (wHTH) protein/Tol biopolymer transport system component
VFDLDAGFLRRDGQEVPLRPKAFEVLKYLVLKHGTLVSKNELVEAVWPDAAVTDNSLSQCLVEVRRAINDDAQTLIRTVARRGYVFDAQISILFSDPHRSVAESRGSPMPLLAPPPQPAPYQMGQIPAVSLDGGVEISAENQEASRQPAWRPRWWLTLTVSVVMLALVGVVFAWWGGQSSTLLAEREVQLTDFNDSAVAPSLSHDGRMLTFIRGGYFGTVAASRGQLYVKVLPAGPTVQLTRDNGSKATPVFSPDDSRIIYTSVMPGLHWDSWQVPVLGGHPQSFLPNASGVTWLGDQRLVYSTIMSGTHMGIASSTESRSNYEEIYFPDQNGMAHRTAPSPDGKSLLVVEMHGGTWLPCRLVPADGSSTGRSVSPPEGQCTSAAWSPDGRWMYFSSNAGGAYHIWRQRFPNGVPEQITFGPTEQEGTAITSDGKYLITSMGLQQASIWIHDQSGERKLTDERYVTQPTMAAAGTQMLYLVRTKLSRGQTSGELWSVDLISGNRQHLLPDLVMANYSLSHDGRKVVFTSVGTERDDGIWIADLDRRSSPQQLIRGADRRAFFGDPGEIVYVGEDSRLYRMREDGSGIERLATDSIAYLSTVSPDGRWAVVIVPQSTTGPGTVLRFMSLRGERSFDVCNEECSVGPRSFLVTRPFSWSTDGNWLYVNLTHFGNSTQRAVVLPYRSDASAELLWPRGLRLEKDVIANPGAKVIDAGYTFPASGAETYLAWRGSTQSNLYRVRIPE